MTVSTVVDHNDYTGNGVTTSFPYTFRIFKKTDLAVSVVDLSENITVLVLDTDYTVTNAGGYNGGNVVLTTPLTNGWQISIARELEPTQETDLRNQGKFFAEVHEDALDKLTMLIQQTYSVFRLALRKPSSIANWYDALNNYIRNVRDPRDPQDAATKNYVDTLASGNLSRTLRVPEPIPQLPDAAARANKMPAFDSAGNPIVVIPPSGSASDVFIELAKPDGEKNIGECQTIAQLRTIEPTYDRQRITLREHTAGTGKGGGQFRAILFGSAYSDNNGTIIKTTGGAVWLRINADILNPLMFGAIPYVDTSTPSAHTAIMAACNSSAGTVDLLGYTYRTSDETYINQTRPIHFRDGKIRPDKTVPNVFRVLNASHRINGVTILGDGASDNNNLGINVMGGADGAVVENCRIANIGRAGITTASKKNIVRNNYIDRAGYVGSGNFRASIWMNEGEHNVMDGNTCLNCNWGIIMRNEIGVTQGYYNAMRNNIVVASSTPASDSQGISASAQVGLTTSGNIVRNFTDNSIDHQNCFGVNIINNQIIGNKDGVFIGDRSCGRIIISENNITNCPTGIRYYNPTGTPFPSQTFSDVQITNNIINSSTFTGIRVDMTGGGSANFMVRVDGNLVDVGGAGGLGIVLMGINQGSACNNQVRRCNGHGIDVSTCEGMRLTNNIIIDCGFGTTGTFNGINLSSCNRCNASDNYVVGSSMIYAVVLGSGSYNMAYTNHARITSGSSAVSIAGGTGNVEANNIKS